MIKCMIVDDEEQNRYFLDVLLREYGYETITVENGRDALNKALLTPPDLIISDLVMPIMDGFTFCRQCKSDDTLKEIPFVFYTDSYVEPKYEKFALALGADRFIPKPQKPEKLINILIDLLAEKKTLNPTAAKPLGEEMEFFRRYNEILFSKLEKKMSELELDNQKLKTWGDRYRLIVENASDVIYTIDTNLYITSMSPCVERILGHKPQDIINLCVSDLAYLFTQESFERSVADAHVILNGGTIPAKIYDFITKDETIKHLEISSSPLIRDGVIIGMMSIARDATERKQSEEAIKNEGLKFRTIFDSASDGILLVHACDRKFSSANKKMCEMIGYKKEDLGELRMDNFHPEESLPYVIEQYEKLIRKEIPIAHDIPLMNKDKMVLFTDVSAKQIIVDGKEYIISMFRDVSDRKRTELNLRSLFAATPVSLCIIKECVYQSVNKAWCETFGYSEYDVIGHTTRILYETEEEYERVSRDLFANLEERGLASVQTRHRRKDGIFRDVILSAATLQTEDLSAVTVVATQDITDSMQEMEELTKSKRQLADIIDFLPDATLVIDKEGKVIAWNRAIEKMTGVKAEAMLGKDDYEYAVPFYGERSPILIDLALHSQAEMESKYSTIQRKGEILSGESYTPNLPSGNMHLSATASVLSGEKGEIIAAIECIRDITERKQLEKDRQRSFEQLRESLGGTVQAIASLVETRDPYTAGHQRRMADLSCIIGAEMRLSKNRLDGLRVASTIHDIGKISIPVEILIVPRKLTDIEFNLIKMHPQSGHDILKDIEFPWPIALMILQHHERMNGSGYPNGLTGEILLLESRIMMVADVVEAIASHRTYRPTMGIAPALEEITKNRGVLYDPEVVDICLRLFNEKGYRLID